MRCALGEEILGVECGLMETDWIQLDKKCRLKLSGNKLELIDQVLQKKEHQCQYKRECSGY